MGKLGQQSKLANLCHVTLYSVDHIINSFLSFSLSIAQHQRKILNI